MANKLYVGNISFDTMEIDLQDHFAQAGTVTDCVIMQDKMTGKSRGFGFVTMATEEEAQNAIRMLHGKPLQNRPLTINEARPREDRPFSGGGGGGGGGRGYGGGGGGGGGGYGGGGGGGGGRREGDRRPPRRY
jgi:RNA recognition motif-containing protein